MDGAVTSALPEWLPRHALDVDAYYELAESGRIRPDDRVELLRGEIVTMAPANAPHAGCVIVLTEMLQTALAGRACVAVQNPLRLDRYNEPEPDLAVLRLPAARYREAHPSAADALLVIEVAESSLRGDRTVKARLYAEFGIAEYWIVDVAGGALIIHLGPSREGYTEVREARRGEVLRPLAFPDLAVAVADILGPPLDSPAPIL